LKNAMDVSPTFKDLWRVERSFLVLLMTTLTLGLVGCSTTIPLTPEPQTLPPTSTVTDRPVTPSATASNTPQPSATLTPTLVCTETTGTVEIGSYQGFVLPEQIPYNIYLPPCYGWEEREYPVLYLLHGFPFDETHWIELGVVDLVDEEVGSDVWPPFLIVMPRVPEPLFTSSDGGPGSYEQEFLEGLMPHIDRVYRTLPSHEDRAIAGVSRGGVWALEIAFRHPDLIEVVAALSPALHVNYARPPYDPFLIVDDGGQLPGRIFLSAGDQEAPFLVQVEKLSKALDERGVPHTFVIGVGGHDAEAWMGVMKEVLDFIVNGWEGDLTPER
jgi:enterochelin esterase-like enzyme